MPLFEIRAIDYYSAQRHAQNVPRPLVIDSDCVDYVCPVGPSMKLANMAPLTARTAVFFTGQDDEYHCVYLQADWLRAPSLATSMSLEAQFIRACIARERTNDEEMTPQRIRSMHCFLAKEDWATQRLLQHAPVPVLA